MSKTLEHEVKPPDSLYWANVLRERDVLKGQLDAMEESLAEKDARIAELERSRPVGDWPEARRLRDVLVKLSDEDFRCVTDGVWVGAGDEADSALAAFCESQPPAPSPVREVVVESEAARKLREALGCQGILLTSKDGIGGVLSFGDERAELIFDALRAFRDSAPPASAPSDEAAHYKAVAQQNAAALAECQIDRKVERDAYELCRKARVDLRAQLDERTRQVAQLQDDLCDARYARDRAQSELAALKSELAVTRENAPTPDEYKRAAVAYAEGMCDWRIAYNSPEWETLAATWEALYSARHSAAASAPALSEWSDERTLGLEQTVIFGKGYDFEGLERRCEEARGPDGRYIVWPHRGRWSLYRESDGALAGDRYASADEAKAECERMAQSEAQRIAASAPDGEKAAPAPADGERVTVYVRLLEGGNVAGLLYSESETRELALAPGQSWLALDARVVREEGAS